MASKTSNTRAGGNQPWTDQHTSTLVRGIIEHLLSSRSSLYHLPGLAGEVDGHGGNRVSQKVIEQCKHLAKINGMDPNVVQDIIAASKGKSSKKCAINGDTQAGCKVQRVKAKPEKTKDESD